MEGMKFEFGKMLQEVRAMNALAVPKFIKNESKRVFKAFEDQLEGFAGNDRLEEMDWEIREEDPLVTKIGSSEPAGRGGAPLYATVSSIWQIKRVKEKKGPVKFFELAGEGSTHIKIFREDETLQLHWHVDLKTNKKAPGYPFHIQVKQIGNGRDGPPVPRFMSSLVTPIECVDFVLGELFHEDWERHQHEKDAKTRSLVSAQGTRVANILEAQNATLIDGPKTQTSWMKLKSWEPSLDICLPG